MFLKRTLIKKEYKKYIEEKRKELQDSDCTIIENNQSVFQDIKQLKQSGMCHMAYIEHYYCCNGPEQCCWEELNETGIWKLTEYKVQKYLLLTLKKWKAYLKNPDRIIKFKFKEDDKDIYGFYIFMRDKRYKKDITFYLSDNLNDVILF